MSTIESAICLIREVHAEVGTAEFARISGVPYTTLKDCEARNFVGPSTETLQKLEKAALTRRAIKPKPADGQAPAQAVTA